jgi:hypothetical protein
MEGDGDIDGGGDNSDDSNDGRGSGDTADARRGHAKGQEGVGRGQRQQRRRDDVLSLACTRK